MPTIERLQKIPNLEFRFIEFGKLGGNGIIHAKYFVVDGNSAYVGSQNFDWRSFSQIHETGLRISDAGMAHQLQAIFEQDWQAQALIAARTGAGAESKNGGARSVAERLSGRQPECL